MNINEAEHLLKLNDNVHKKAKYQTVLFLIMGAGIILFFVHLTIFGVDAKYFASIMLITSIILTVINWARK